MMNVQIRHRYEGLLHKYTNAMKGWQYRWFILSPETGELHYFLSESEKNQRPRCSIYLAGAVIAPSDEDSNTFTVNSATGDMIKLRAMDARARQEWVDKLRAVTEMYTRAIASSHPPLPPREHSANSNRNPVAKLEVLDAFANCQEQLNKVEKHNLALAQTIESSSLNLDPDLINVKDAKFGEDFTGKICVILDNIKETKKIGKSCGFHLTKSKWDPYPWISHIETGSLADTSGLRAGDCLLNIDGKDLIGLKIKQIATLIQNYQESNLKLFVWRYISKGEEEKEAGIAIKGPLPEVTSKLANAVSGVVRALECPVCLESSLPPVSQCVHGHIICVGCRSRTPRCPICRVRLGQGRCLLADKLHKMFRDVFDMKDNLCNNVECHTRNLRDRLFGKSKKKEEMRVVGKSNDTSSKTRQLLLSKLFRGGLEKAASADNLTVISNETSNANTTLIDNLNLDERLNLHDRTKSASTGELSKETIKNVNSNLQINTINTTMFSTNSLMSNVSATPIWGGSMDSVSSIKIMCPLSKQSGCKNIITPDMVLKHLSGTHEVPQVHFYSVCAKLPVPLPFGPEAVYILHCREDLFFFQYEDETVWISTTGGKIAWEWTLHGQGQNGTEIKMRRNVASLVNSMVLTPRHIAPLPSALLLHTLDIQLIECQSHEQLQI